MEKWRIAVLIGIAAALLAGAIATWGSVGSAVLVFCLLILVAGVLYQRFLNRDDPGDWGLFQ